MSKRDFYDVLGVARTASDQDIKSAYAQVVEQTRQVDPELVDRAECQPLRKEGAKTKVRALVPQSELDRYATTLRSLTQGRAYHKRRLHGYEEVPSHVAAKIIEQAKKEKEEVHA